MIRESWSGDEWQTHCRELLAMAFGEDIQFVPDRDSGDGGLEAYRLDRGVAYQCYAPQESFDVKSQTEAQKHKIYTDIKKLVDKPEQTCEIIGEGVILERWILLTPQYDSKELVKYARKKSRDTRGSDRPRWCHDSFEITIHTDELFAAQRAVLLGSSSPLLSLEVPHPEPEVIQESASSEVGGKLREKLSDDPALAADDEALRSYLEETLVDYIRGSDQYKTLEDQYANSYSLVKSGSDAMLRSLTRVMISSKDPGPTVVEQLVERLSDTFVKTCPSLSPVLASDLARYFVAEWFISCPLKFRKS